MGAIKRWWFQSIKYAIALNGDFGKEVSPQAETVRQAIAKAREITEASPDGRLHMQVVDMVLIRKTHTYAGAAMAVHVSERTAQGWTLAYIDKVAELAGYKVCAKKR